MTKSKKNNFSLGISTRLVLIIGAATILVTSISGTYGTYQHGKSLFDAEKERAGAFLESLALPCAISLATNAIENLDNYMSEAVRSPSTNTRLLSLSMVNHQGFTVINSTRKSNNPTKTIGSELKRNNLEEFIERAHESTDPIWEKTETTSGKPTLLMSMPAVSGLRWGTLVASFDLSIYERRVSELLKYNLYTNITYVILLVLALYAAMSTVVLRPLRTLTSSMQELHAGSLDTRIPTVMSGEMGELARGFNDMAEELEDYTRTLEQNVEERSREVRKKTRELERLNLQLHYAVNKLETLVRTDELTGVYNRRYLTEALQIEIRKSARTGRPFSVAMMDVDHFKRLNDEYGHAIGDHVLATVAGLLKEKLRSTDVVARYGGEEFVIIFFDTSKSSAFAVSEGLRALIAETSFDTEAVQIRQPVTVSIGISTCPTDGGDGNVILEKADEAMYAAKKNGRNQVKLWSELDD
ncbi:MAG: diguanylate cyclase [Myxococcota bacterium]|nr:diguanylate cyclase [Myxococcota bacterium]